MSYDDNHSTDRYWPSGRPLHECPLDAADPIDGTTTLYTIEGLPPIGIAISFALLTGAETLMIIGGYGWWVLPVAMIVAMFCVMFVGLSWAMGRDIMRINREAMARPARKTPELRKMMCEDCPHGRRRPEPPPTRRRIDIAGNAYAAPGVLPNSGKSFIPPDVED